MIASIVQKGKIWYLLRTVVLSPQRKSAVERNVKTCNFLDGLTKTYTRRNLLVFVGKGMVDKLPYSTINGGTDRCNIYEWNPLPILYPPYVIGSGHGCIVLNREIKIPPHVVRHLWDNAYIRCCVDGGTNRWLHFMRTHNMDGAENLKLPDLITGDFDSITAESQTYFANKSIKLLHTPDQNATDFSKAVDVVKPILREKQMNDIIVFHDSSGRFDQIMANINTLFSRHDNYLNIYLLTGDSLTWLLKPGKHSIIIPPDLVMEKTWCSLIPIGHEATKVTTKGLKWNLTNGCLQFGGMVSTSNTYASDLIEVVTNAHLIWSMGVFSFKDD